MKKKSFMILLVFVVFCSVVVWLFNTPSPHLRNIVSKTQLQIKNINSKLQVLEQDDAGKDFEVESTYLELLGFVKDPNLFDSKQFITSNEEKSSIQNSSSQPQNQINSQESNDEQHQNAEPTNNNNNKGASRSIKIPPLVTAFSRFGDKENYLIESKMNYFLNDLLLIYDLDLSSSEHLKV